MKLYFTFILILIIFFFGCKKDSNETAIDYAYIGGKIINPNTNYVVLFKNKTILDTIRLDGRNRFLFKINSLQEGLYTFRHGEEYQMILLEPKDSVLFRLNTLDFDESLVFTGIGDKKNNYLINQFLENEKEEKYNIKLCQLNPIDFQKHVDSIRYSKIKTLERFKKKYEPSNLFEKYARANIDYRYYSSKEVYPFWHYGKNKIAILESLPDNFYDYRKDINYNDESLSHYFNYSTFLRHNFSNLALESHDKHSDNKLFNRWDLCYNLDRLKLIDSLVTNTSIKDELLYHFTISYISKSKNEKKCNKMLKSYLSKSQNKAHKRMIALYAKSVNNLKEGSKLPLINLINYNASEIEINSVINSPTVISFWSQKYYDHFKESHYKLKELKVKYPEIKFITINIDKYGLENSKKMLLGHGFDSTNEYQFKNPAKTFEILAIHPMTKTIIIDKNKRIVNSNTNLFSIYFEEQLLGLINR
ncbi:thioredoxin family protein [Flaviramulus aquimarinus]|uniref:Thioredoxin family protein n=1 Tax=Flaviramulus aquimarinus TaxID=1170456 RepID=A0ABP9EMD2_9FLAO